MKTTEKVVCGVMIECGSFFWLFTVYFNLRIKHITLCVGGPNLTPDMHVNAYRAYVIAHDNECVGDVQYWILASSTFCFPLDDFLGIVNERDVPKLKTHKHKC